MAFEKIRKGLHIEPPVVAQLKARQWTNDAQKKELIDKFLALQDTDVADLAWTAVDPTPEIRSAGLSLLKKKGDRAALDALVPYLRTRSEAARRAVQRFIKDVAGDKLGTFLTELSDVGDHFARLAALELARELPPETAFLIFQRVLEDSNPTLRTRALKAASESGFPGASALAANLALPLLQDEDEEIRLSALSVLERNPSEALISHVVQLASSGGGRVADAAFAALRRLLPMAQADHTAEILPLLADGTANVRQGALTLLQNIPPDILARSFLEYFRGAFVWMRDRATDSASKGLPSFVPAMLELTRDPDPQISKAALEMALTIPDARAIPAWMSLLDNPDWWVRNRALERLGQFGAGREDVFTRLLRALGEKESVVSAAAALGELGDPRASQHLLEAFKAAMSQPEDQLEILDAMGHLGAKDQRIGPMLAKISVLEHLPRPIREKARHLVGKLQGEEARDALPMLSHGPHEIDFSATRAGRIVDFLSDTVARGASDFHLATGFVPHRRMHGVLQPLDLPIMERPRALELIREILGEEKWHLLERERQLDVCIKVPGLGRFRANFFSHREGFDASFRVIPGEIPTLSEIGLPESIWDVTRYSQGLVLVTGPAGCGKSTTLAALLDRINESRPCHIITIEDPIEFVHQNKEALINQRQVPDHTGSFARALRAALREDPDVILIGEMRDLDTISLAISASETGHLVFGTLSTTTAPATIDRIINSFPPAQQGQIRAMISDSLKAVISQALLPRRGGYGRVAAFEILRGTQAIGALIRESKTFQIQSALQTGQLSGMNTMDQALQALVEKGRVDPEAALDRAVKKEPFEKLLNDERQALSS